MSEIKEKEAAPAPPTGMDEIFVKSLGPLLSVKKIIIVHQDLSIYYVWISY